MVRPIAMKGPIGELAKKLNGTEKLAEELGVTSFSINNWASGRNKPSRLTVEVILDMCSQHEIKVPDKWKKMMLDER